MDLVQEQILVHNAVKQSHHEHGLLQFPHARGLPGYTLAVVGDMSGTVPRRVGLHLWVIAILAKPLKHCSNVSRLV